jgi:hypothetical protein
MLQVTMAAYTPQPYDGAGQAGVSHPVRSAGYHFPSDPFTLQHDFHLPPYSTTVVMARGGTVRTEAHAAILVLVDWVS